MHNKKYILCLLILQFLVLGQPLFSMVGEPSDLGESSDSCKCVAGIKVLSDTDDHIAFDDKKNGMIITLYKNPKITEDEKNKLSHLKSWSEDVLRKSVYKEGFENIFYSFSLFTDYYLRVCGKNVKIENAEAGKPFYVICAEMEGKLLNMKHGHEKRCCGIFEYQIIVNSDTGQGTVRHRRFIPRSIAWEIPK